MIWAASVHVSACNISPFLRKTFKNSKRLPWMVLPYRRCGVSPRSEKPIMCLYVSKLKHRVKVPSKHLVASSNFQVRWGWGKWARRLLFMLFTKQPSQKWSLLWVNLATIHHSTCRSRTGNWEEGKKPSPDARVIWKRDECPWILLLTLDCKRPRCMFPRCKNMIEQFHLTQREKKKGRERMFDESFQRQELSCVRWHVPPLLQATTDRTLPPTVSVLLIKTWSKSLFTSSLHYEAAREAGAHTAHITRISEADVQKGNCFPALRLFLCLCILLSVFMNHVILNSGIILHNKQQREVEWSTGGTHLRSS